MNNQTSLVAKLDVGTPRSSFQRWEMAEVCFHEFADLPATRDEETESPKFNCLGHRWSVSIYPGGDEDSDDGEVAVYLCHDSDSNGSIEIHYSFTVRNWDGKEVAHASGMDIFTSNDSSNNCVGEIDFAKRSTIMKTLVEGTLTIEVRMKKIGPAACSSTAFIPDNPICENILELFMDEETADVVFEVGGQQAKKKGRKKANTSSVNFHVHRLILQKSAPTLGEMCGSSSGRGLTSVPIADANPDVFKHMMYYIYGGNIDEELEKNPKDLIEAADKFGVVSLKLEAEACYVKFTKLTVDNVIENLLFAESKNCALLKEAAMDFILEKGDDILGNVSFGDVPGAMMTDLLAAVMRGKKSDDLSEAKNFNKMRISTLRRMLDKQGLEVDGSREAMVALLKENEGEHSEADA